MQTRFIFWYFAEFIYVMFTNVITLGGTYCINNIPNPTVHKHEIDI